jgi:hypothetical protein
VRRCVGRCSARVSRTRGAKIIRGTVGDGPEDVREDITGRVDIVYVVVDSEWCRDEYRQRCIEMDGSIYATLVRAFCISTRVGVQVVNQSNHATNDFNSMHTSNGSLARVSPSSTR